MTMVSAAAPSPISAYRRGGAWWHGRGRFPCSFFLSPHYPAEREEGSERHANVFRGARDYAAFLAAGAKRSRQRQRAGGRASEDLACLADQLVDGQYKYDKLDTKLCETRIIIPQKALRCIVRLCRHNKTVSELLALSHTLG